jgi:hypothetical protein
MSQATLLGLPLELEFRGQAIKLGPITFEVEAYFSDWVFRRALDRLNRQRELGPSQGGIGEEEYQFLLGRLADNQSAGRYDWDGDLSLAARRQEAGYRHLVYLRMRACDPTVKASLVDEIFQDAAALRRLMVLLDPTRAVVESGSNPPAAPVAP